jgi:membrane fusion protein (multidrug efflux system)
MSKKIVIAIAGVVLIFIILAGIKALQIRSMLAASAAMAQPAQAVTSAEVQQETWQPTLSAVGSVSAVQGVTVSAELAGTVTEIAFESGASVNKGDLLVQLDIAAEEAQLRSAQADAELTRLELDRARDLQQRKVIAASEWDTAQAKNKAAIAQVDNIQSVIAKKTIRAPFSGRAGIRQINLGQFVNAGQQIVSLQSLDPVYVDFSLPQQRLADLAVGMEVRVVSDSFVGKVFGGKLTALNSSLDAATRSVPLQATLDNPDGLLRPGMFAKVEVVLPENKPVLVIPATAVSYAPYGDSVFIIEQKRDEKTGAAGLAIRQQFVRLGDTRGDFVAIASGLAAGQQIVSSGVFKLRHDGGNSQRTRAKPGSRAETVGHLSGVF